MDTQHTLAELAGHAIATAIAIGEKFDAAALRNHANYVGAAMDSPEAAMAFAQALRDTLVAQAQVIEQA